MVQRLKLGRCWRIGVIERGFDQLYRNGFDIGIRVAIDDRSIIPPTIMVDTVAAGSRGATDKAIRPGRITFCNALDQLPIKANDIGGRGLRLGILEPCGCRFRIVAASGAMDEK